MLLAYRGSDLPYTIWFYTNKSLWQQQRASHYSQVMLKGEVPIAGVDYLAYITGTGTNDGRFVNDDILIGLNQDGKFGDGERVGRGNVAKFNGKRYQLDIDW